MVCSRVLLFLALSCSSVLARNFNIGLCDDWNIDCKCGASYQITIPIKQCSYIHRWQAKCRPCNRDFNKDAFCSQFANCLECSRERCNNCPPNRYGQWCSGVCQCQNGGTCNSDGVCFCPPGFTGSQCQTLKCLSPEAMANTDISVSNNDIGSTAIYTCQPGYSMPPDTANSRVCGADGRWSGHAPHCLKRCPSLDLPGSLTADPDMKNQQWYVRSTTFKCLANAILIGPVSINCLSNGVWDSQPPRCEKPCPTPEELPNGHAFYHAQELIEGGKVKYVCVRNFNLVGAKESTCVNGNWSHPPPTCEKILYCSDLGVPEFGERQVERGIGDEMSVGTKITYNCTKDSILIGASKSDCLSNATWSKERPYCIFVSDKEITCDIKGSDIVASNHAPLRITCPDGCLKTNAPVWGTVIYKKDSRVCASAIHAGMIPKEGGSVLVVNNGLYNQFVPSSSNGIKTKRSRGAFESYRFNYVDADEETRCPKGWAEVGDQCVVYVDRTVAWKGALSICQNLNSNLVGLDSDNQTEEILGKIESRINFAFRGRIWSEKAPPPPQLVIQNNVTVNQTEEISNYTSGLLIIDQPKSQISIAKKILNGDDNECGAVDIIGGDIHKEDCQQKLSFLCSTAARILEPEGPVCDEPDSIPHGNFEVIDEMDSVNSVGTVVRYRCQNLYYLSGRSDITCTENATWSSPPPKCIKASACEDPPYINNGFFDPIPEPKSRISQVPATTQAPKKLTAAEKHLAESEKVTLPKNYHRINTKMQFECESRYYKLIGSSTRTCMADSQWSGRQPSCQPVCGTSSAPRSPFIVGGKPTIAGQWPWQVGIARKIEIEDETKSEQQFQWYLACGAALLTESWVVTAAHCVTVEGTSLLVDSSELKLYFGKFYRNDSRDDSEVQIRDVQSIQIFPNFNPVIYDGDIALINLKSPVKLSGRVQPVCLTDPYSGMSDRHLKIGSVATVTGWGRDNNSDTESYPEVLMQAEVKIVGNDECEAGYRMVNVPLSVTGNMFCAGNDNTGGKTDSCSGDSGGPLMVSEGTGVNERWYLEGIVSWGSPRGCGMEREYGGYTKVSAFLEWIQTFI